MAEKSSDLQAKALETRALFSEFHAFVVKEYADQSGQAALDHKFVSDCAIEFMRAQFKRISPLRLTRAMFVNEYLRDHA